MHKNKVQWSEPLVTAQLNENPNAVMQKKKLYRLNFNSFLSLSTNR